MSYLQISKEEIAQRGESLYEKSIRPHAETVENIGKMIAIDINTGAYEIDRDLVLACRQVRTKYPDAVIWIEGLGTMLFLLWAVHWLEQRNDSGNSCWASSTAQSYSDSFEADTNRN